MNTNMLNPWNWGKPAGSYEAAPTVEAPPVPPTVTFAIPFPEIPHGCTSKSVPPFLLYAPLAARLVAPGEGEKESLQNKAQRHWQETEAGAKEAVANGGAGFKDKAINMASKAMSMTKNSKVEFLVRTPAAANLKELRVVYPSSMPGSDIQEKFNEVLKQTKSAAIRNGIIATAALPFVLVFDLTFIPGPFEVNAVFAIASWTGAARASSIANGVADQKVEMKFVPDDRMDHLAFRVHEICWENRKVGVPMSKPHWTGEHEPLRGVELASLVLAMINVHVDLGADEIYERDLERVSEDLEQVFVKGAKEWLATIA